MIESALIDIAKLAFAGLIVVAGAAFFIKPYLNRYVRLQHLDFKKSLNGQTLPLKLQAYERLVLFTDRINPANMVIRLHDAQLSAKEFEALLVNEIRNEYQHNITQQLYVSAQAWVVIRKIKDDTLALIRNTGASFTTQNSSGEMSKVLLNHLGSMETDPYLAAAALLKNDLNDLF